jgi:hypothetical protein
LHSAAEGKLAAVDDDKAVQKDYKLILLADDDKADEKEYKLILLA